MRVQQLGINETDRSYSRNPPLVVVALDHNALMTRILRSGKRRRDTSNASPSDAGRPTPSLHNAETPLVVGDEGFLLCILDFFCLEVSLGRWENLNVLHDRHRGEKQIVHFRLLAAPNDLRKRRCDEPDGQVED